MIKVIITDNARNDLSGIIRYIARDNPKRAEIYVEELLKKADTVISAFPLSCPLHNKTLNIRCFAYQKYNVYYQYNENNKTVYILNDDLRKQ